jgi:lipopolysaccharide/colanic/teichoic acid biosynthesis glycosyltransferase
MQKITEYKTPFLVSQRVRDVGYIDHRLYYLCKRIVDLTFSLLILFFLSPFLIMISILIVLDSPGPVFFKQNRVGSRRVKTGDSTLWKRVDFSCYKFRTMAHNTNDEIHKAYIKALIANDEKTMRNMEGEGNQKHKLVNDSRITRFGRFLRRYSLDEVPQFWNVVRGEMSLVGPRPALPYEIELYNPRHFLRLNAKPGITGLQQITARNTATFEEQIALDIRYVEEQSWGLDVWILLKTPFAIFIQKGA